MSTQKKTYISEDLLSNKPKKGLGLIINEGAVTTPKIRDNAVTTEKIADSNVTTDKLKDNNVTWDKLSHEVQNDFTTLKNVQDAHDTDITKLKKQAVNMVVISQEDYDNLVLSGTVDANTYYNVFEQ